MKEIQKMYGRDLIFISRINADGKGITDVSLDNMSFENNTKFTLIYLSMSQKTLIASEMSTYTVKLK
jgi:hypothetical protein